MGKKKHKSNKNFFEIGRNKLKGSKSNFRLRRKIDFKEDSKDGKNENKIIRSKKAVHFNNTLISEDSSDISFTEVKLSQLYSRSRKMQKDLVNSSKNNDHTIQFRNALKNVMQLDIVRE